MMIGLNDRSRSASAADRPAARTTKKDARRREGRKDRGGQVGRQADPKPDAADNKDDEAGEAPDTGSRKTAGGVYEFRTEQMGARFIASASMKRSPR